MFTNITASYNNGDVLIESACLSTDTKPTDGIANGSACIEMDTGDKYMFDEAGGQWIKLGSGGGGDAEVWLVGDTGTEVQGMMTFVLSNVDATDHMSELITNGANYNVFLNGTPLPQYTGGEGYGAWSDAETPTMAIELYSSGGTTSGSATYMDASTAPTSVEVSVKAK